MPQLELVTSEVARRQWRRTATRVFRDVFQPQPHLTPSEWAPKHRVISVGPQAGRRWRNETTPYLMQIIDFMAAPWAQRGVVRKSARVGYTEGVIGNGIAYSVSQDPCPLIVLQPSNREAEAYSKENVTPLIQRNPSLRDRIGPMGVRSSDSTITYKEFPGGFLALLGSASDKNLRRRSAKRAFADEVDAMKAEGAEGDPLLRLQKRTDDYDDGVLLVGSTPTRKGESRIDEEFERSDQRYWHVPCPHCEELQVLRWGGPDKPYGIKWEKEISCRGCGVVLDEDVDECPDCGSAEVSVRHLHDTAHYTCRFCGRAIEEADKAEMVRAGQWIPTNPESSIPGWHIDALISLFPGARWPKLSLEFVQATEPELLKVFVQQVLGQAWEERGEQAPVTGLEARAEQYVSAAGEAAVVPDGVGVLVAGVDVQGDRIELLVRGWGTRRESWDILHERIYGDAREQNTWARLDYLLKRTYRHEPGRDMRLMATMIDAGAITDTVYSFVGSREPLNIWACMGDKGRPGAPPLKRSTRANSDGVKLWTVGTYTLKDDLFSRLRVQRSGARYIHLRAAEPELCNGFDAEYFAQFTAEKKVRERVKGERRHRYRFVQTRTRNEAIDLHVYADAAFHALGAGIHGNMEAWVEWAREEKQEETAEEATGTEGRARRGSWATRWK